MSIKRSRMKNVFLNPDEAKRVAMAGKLDLETRFTPEQTGLRMKQRLETLWEAQSA